MILDIHLEGIDTRGEKQRTKELEEILQQNVPVAISIAPFSLPEHWYSPETLELVRAIVQREGSHLGQQGLNHKCYHEHKLVDPWHENVCLWKPSPSAQQQRELMQKGKALLEDTFGIPVTLYVPPNHLFNTDTIDIASELGYRFFADKSIIPLSPYSQKNMIVVPETKISTPNRPAYYIHYDEIPANRGCYEKILAEASSLDVLKPQTPRRLEITANTRLKHLIKRLRDIKKMASSC